MRCVSWSARSGYRCGDAVTATQLGVYNNNNNNDLFIIQHSTSEEVLCLF